MPTYEYRCKDCADEIEVQQAFTDAALTECPSCGGTLKKKFSAVGISFKGSGFYKTDSRSGGSSSSGANGKDTKESSGESSSSSTSSSDPAPAKKAESSSPASSSSSSSTAPATSGAGT